MSEPDQVRSVIVIVRAWVEPRLDQPFRAIVTTATADGSEDATRRATVSVDEACEIVRAALQAIVGEM